MRQKARADFLCCELLLALTALMLLPGALSLPMELWDESRNATNAMEMAAHGNWMVPTFAGLPDHWNTKPPLLIWIMSGLLRTGMTPMLAIRLPSVAATMGSVLLVYFACRVTLQDRLAGVLGGLLLIGSVLFMADHVGRTGDHDALLTFLTLGCVLCVGRYIDAPSAVWIGAGGVLLMLAILTKGVAAGLPVPGLIIYAIIRRRFGLILRDWRLWTVGTGVIAGITGYLALREQLDPGYIAAMWHNDVAGRSLSTIEAHAEAPWFYLMVLVLTVQPAVLLSPALLTLWRDRDPARRRLCLLLALTAASWLLILSCAGTKIYWYAAPIVPLLAIATAAATTSFIRRGGQWRRRLALSPVLVGLPITFCYINGPVLFPAVSDQVRYDTFLRGIRGTIPLDGVVIVDHGVPNEAGFSHYNPVARFAIADAERSGEHISLIAPGDALARDATIVSCDPQVRDWLKSRSFFTVLRGDQHCILGRAAPPESTGAAPEG